MQIYKKSAISRTSNTIYCFPIFFDITRFLDTYKIKEYVLANLTRFTSSIQNHNQLFQNGPQILWSINPVDYGTTHFVLMYN